MDFFKTAMLRVFASLREVLKWFELRSRQNKAVFLETSRLFSQAQRVVRSFSETKLTFLRLVVQIETLKLDFDGQSQTVVNPKLK